jgi:hypothetical protein
LITETFGGYTAEAGRELGEESIYLEIGNAVYLIPTGS